jgi:hypothetical protein
MTQSLGRMTWDEDGTKKHARRCQKETKICCCKLRTMKDEWKHHETCWKMLKQNWGH